MLRSTKIANELAVIERKLQETSNQTLKDALKKKQARLKDELNDAKKSTPQLAKKLLAEKQKVKSLSKIDFNDLVRRLSKKPEYSFLKTMNKSTVRTDLERKAKPVGWRFKGRGNYDKPTQLEIKKGKKSGAVYRENRPIRSDVSHIVRLGEGGVVINGISINVGDKGTYGRSKEQITITGITPKIINFTTSEGKKKGIYRDAFAKSYVPNGSKKNDSIQVTETNKKLDSKSNTKIITAADKKELQPYKVLEYRKKAWKYTKEKYKYEKQLLDRLIGNDYAFKVLSFYKEKGGSNLTANIHMGTIEITCIGCSDSFLLAQFDVIDKYGYGPKDKFVRISISTARSQVDYSDPKTRYNLDDLLKLAAYKKEKMEHGGTIEIGDRVKASKEYGGKSGTVIDKRGSFVVVEYSNGDSDSYHESDLIKKMEHGGGVDKTIYTVAGRPVTLNKGQKENGTDWTVTFLSDSSIGRKGEEIPLSDVLALIKPFPKGIKKMEHGGSILTEEQEEAFNEWKNDGNVAEAGKDVYTTQDSQWSNRIKGIDNLKKYYYNEFLKN